MIKLALIASLATVPVSQCARVVVPAGGGSVVRPAAQPAQPQRPIAPGAHVPILSDPESRQEPWSDVVWATSKDKAEEICRTMAEDSSDRDATVQFDSIEQLAKKPNAMGKYPFRCWFTSFIRSYDDERNHDN